MRTWVVAGAVVIALAGSAAGTQEKPAPPPQEKPLAAGISQPRESATLVPLKVTVVLSRHQGEKRVSSLPYVIGVTANGPRTTLRMGNDVPVPMTVFGGAKPAEGGIAAPTSYSYQSVGTNIDCQASGLAGGIFQLALTVSDSSIHLASSEKPRESSAIAANIPSFRKFDSSFTILLRDGQTTQYTSATDPVTGEVMKIDVTVNVLK